MLWNFYGKILVIFKLYTGMRPLIVLAGLAWLYLLFAEKDKKIKTLYVFAPVLILLLFLCPLSRKFFVAAGLDGATYYRVLWTIPLGVITAYGLCRMFEKHRRIGLAVSSALIIFCGNLVYKSAYISKAENLYHIPDTVVRICDLIAPEGVQGQVMVGWFPRSWCILCGSTMRRSGCPTGGRWSRGSGIITMKSMRPWRRRRSLTWKS